MWNRIELKAAAKQRFHSNYWPSVVVAVILSITLGTFSFGNSFSNATSDNYYSSSDINNILSDSPIPDSSYSDMSAYMKNYISVSYTHLDVYKRQSWNTPISVAIKNSSSSHFVA